MATRDLDAEIDRLYQLPLNEFTAARNGLAKELKRADINQLEKPNLAAWAVNQLYWTDRAHYDGLLRAAERLRAEHRKLLAGKASDLRDAEKAHRDAIRDAARRVREILQTGGHATSDATLTAVQETLEALPSGDPPGRLTQPLKPLGFAALAGIPIKAGGAGAARSDRNTSSAAAPLKLVKSDSGQKRAREESRRREKEERERQERRREAEKALKAAESAMLKAEEAVKRAEKTLAELRARRDEAVAEYQRARLRAHD